MAKFLMAVVGVVTLLFTTGFAGEPTHDLDPKVAVKLIALKANVPENTIQLPFIIDGKQKQDKDFEASHVRRVAAVLAVRNGTAQSRKLVFFDMMWNEELGWFMWEVRAERAGEAVYIWSELKDYIVVK